MLTHDFRDRPMEDCALQRPVRWSPRRLRKPNLRSTLQFWNHFLQNFVSKAILSTLFRNKFGERFSKNERACHTSYNKQNFHSFLSLKKLSPCPDLHRPFTKDCCWNSSERNLDSNTNRNNYNKGSQFLVISELLTWLLIWTFLDLY